MLDLGEILDLKSIQMMFSILVRCSIQINLDRLLNLVREKISCFDNYQGEKKEFDFRRKPNPQGQQLMKSTV